MYKLITSVYREKEDDEPIEIREYVKSHHARCDLTKEMQDVDDNN